MEQSATYFHAPLVSSVRKWYQTGFIQYSGIVSHLDFPISALVCTRLQPFWVVLIFALLCIPSAALAAADDSADNSAHNQVRMDCQKLIGKYVSNPAQKKVERLCDGEKAELGKLTLPADLLKQLLSAPDSLLPHNRIVIANAIFDQDIDLSNMTLQRELRLEDCEFEGRIDLHSVKTDYEISFERSVFRKSFDMHNAKVQNSLNLKDVEFKFETQFKLTKQSLANLKKDELPEKALDKLEKFLKNKLFKTPEELWRDVEQVIGKDQIRHQQLILQHADHSENVNFARSEVARTLELDGAILHNRLDFRFAIVHGNLRANGTRFFSMYGSADFSDLHVGQVGFFNRAIFAGPAVFHSMTVGDHVEAVEAEFHKLLDPSCQLGSRNLEDKCPGQQELGAKILMGGAVSLSRCLQSSDRLQSVSYQCPASFANVKVDGNVVFIGAKFWGPVRLPGIQIKGNLLFDQALFTRSVVLQSASIEGYVSAQKRAQFHGFANLAGMSINGDLLLQGALFNAKVDMSASTIGSDLQLEAAYFAQVADFRSMTIGGDLSGTSARFAHKHFVDKKRCLQQEQATLDKEQATLDSVPTRFMNLRVGSHLNLLGTDFAGPVDFSKMEVGGHASFADSQTHFRECVLFEHAKFTGNLDISRVRFESLVNMKSTHVGGDLIAQNTKFHFSSSDADMAKERYRAKPYIAPTNFNDMRVTGSAFFGGVVFEGLVNFYSVSIGGSCP